MFGLRHVPGPNRSKSKFGIAAARGVTDVHAPPCISSLQRAGRLGSVMSTEGQGCPLCIPARPLPHIEVAEETECP